MRALVFSFVWAPVVFLALFSLSILFGFVSVTGTVPGIVVLAVCAAGIVFALQRRV